MKVTLSLGTWVHSITMFGYYDNGRNAHNQRSVECNCMILNPTHYQRNVHEKTIKCTKIHPCMYMC